MKIGIVSHIVKDLITDVEGNKIESFGGPACYGSILSKTFKIQSKLFTKTGSDINNNLEYLKKNEIILENDQIDKDNPTTQFQLVLNKDGDGGRNLFLLSKCSPIIIDHQDINNLDGIILSPVIDEIPMEIFNEITKTNENKFVMLDPQGFLRIWNKETLLISYKEKLDLDLTGVTAIKTDEQELAALTGRVNSLEGMKLLKKKFSLEFVILTMGNNVSLLNKNTLYSLSFKKFSNVDTTGLGDILTAGFSCSFLKEKDPLWALCFGVGSIIASLSSNKKGIDKVPRKMNLIERNASYFYNLAKFKIID
jgi:sugar/nucleoside kinase (ribokinase family)